MLQRYDISMNAETNRLSIKEFAVIERISQKHEYSDPDKENYSLIHEVTYDGDVILAAINDGQKALIAELRSDDFFPIYSYAETIAERVIELFIGNSGSFSELFFDDRALFLKDDEN
jgi:hypothetical protein